MFSHGKKCYDPTRITCECFHKIFLLRNATDLTMVDLTKYLPTDLWKFWAIEPSFSRNICHQKSSVVVQSPVFTKYFAKERPVKEEDAHREKSSSPICVFSLASN